VLRSVGKFVIALFMTVPLAILIYMHPPGTSTTLAKAVAPAQVYVTDTPEGAVVSWQPVPGALKYTVFWGFERGDYKNLFDTTSAKVVLCNLRKGDLYYVAVTTWISTGESNYSHDQIVIFDDNPSHAKIHLSKASEFMERSAYQEAYAHISTAVKLAPNNPDVYKDRALLYEKVARPDLAKQDHATAKKLYENTPISLNPTRPSRSY
jgi:tetratricopeptide (TPR) repeat protein